MELLADDPIRMAAQILGLFPMVLAFFTYLFNDRRKVIGLKMMSDLLWAVHFLMLGEMAGCVINLINTVRNVIFSRKDRKKWASHISIPILFCGLSMAGTIAVWDGARSILPLLGSALAIVGFWCSKPKMMRRFILPGVFLWLVYGIVTYSVSTIICNVVSIVSMMIAERNSRRAGGEK